VPGVTALTEIGRGGFATVYRGYQARFDRWVAVKILDVGRLDGASLRRFERECAIMGRLSGHPNVVTVYDSGVLGDQRPFLLTEFCEGGALSGLLARAGPLPAGQVVAVGARLASALAEAHGHGIVHRDVKPGNVLLRASGEPALTDFGLSLYPDRDPTRGLDAFSLEYAAPETLEDGESTPAGDVYSLGATLYAIAAGGPPLPRQPGEAPIPYARRLVAEPVPPLPRTDLPAGFHELVHQAMAKRPADRPPASALVERLGAAEPGTAAEAPTSPRPPAAPPGDVDPGGLRTGTAPREDDEATTRLRQAVGVPAPRSSRARWYRALTIAAFAGAVVAAVAVAAVLLRREDRPPPPAAAPPATTVAPATQPPTSAPTTTAPATTAPGGGEAPAGFQRVSGSGGLTVAIPEGWRVTPAANPAIAQATDPADEDRFVRYGGEPPTGGTLRDQVTEFERQLQGVGGISGYEQLKLRQVEYGDADEAVDWEFTFTRGGRRRHASARYWRIGGTGYVVYAESTDDEFNRMVPVLGVLVETARPK